MVTTSERDVEFEKLRTNHYRLTGSESTRVDPELFVDEPLLEVIRQKNDRSLQQLINAASLPGVTFVGGMPDVHEGYGVPVGCVMAMDAEDGLVSAGAVGMDINCGVRLLRTNLPADELSPEERKQLGRAILKRVPVGIGTTGPYQDTLGPMTEEFLLEGVKALVDTPFASEGDRERIQDHGCYENARLDPVTDRAWERLDQFGTLGGGNHFLEIVEVGEVSGDSSDAPYGLRTGNLGFLIHTGSRGFGHQICQDYSGKMMDQADEFDLSFPTKQLASAPIHSDLGGDYLGAMACAANVAYANRQMMTHSVRAACYEFFEDASVELDPEIVYDITHNLARFESVENREHLVHRKGAVRALPADHPDNPEVYGNVGHPVMVPGNMGTGTYVLQAGERITDTYFSINHGAGRQMSRTQAKEEISEEMLLEALGDVQLLGASRKKIRDEAPQAYKNIRNVIDVLTDAKIASTVAHLKPLVVIKGE